MKALILSTFPKSDIFNEQILSKFKAIANDFDRICFIFEQENEENLLKAEQFLQKLNIAVFVLNLKKANGELKLIKAGVRFLHSLNEFDYIFYVNNFNQLGDLNTYLNLFFANEKTATTTFDELFSNRFRNYKNVYSVQDLIEHFK